MSQFTAGYFKTLLEERKIAAAPLVIPFSTSDSNISRRARVRAMAHARTVTFVTRWNPSKAVLSDLAGGACAGSTVRVRAPASRSQLGHLHKGELIAEIPKKIISKLRHQNSKLAAALSMASEVAAASERRATALKAALVSMHATWSDTYKGSLGEECKHGLGMTDVQYGGARNLLCKMWSPEKNCYVKRPIPLTKNIDYPKGLFVPEMPNVQQLRQRAREYGEELGLRECHSGLGAMVDCRKAILFCLVEAGTTINGTYIVQIIGDAHRATKTYGVTNICCRGGNSCPFFNAIRTMHRM